MKNDLRQDQLHSFIVTAKIVSVTMRLHFNGFLTVAVVALSLVILVLMADSAVKEVSSVKATPLSTSNIDWFIMKRMAEENIPGMAVVVTRDSDVTYLKCFGVNSVQELLLLKYG